MTTHTYRVYPTVKLLHFRVEPQVKKKMGQTLHYGDNTSTHQCSTLFFFLSAKPNVLFVFSVAIFDILQAPPSIDAPNPHPFALLQPRLRLPDLFPSKSLSLHHLPNLEAAYVGLVEETDSLFIMSPEGFPLVVFGGNEAKDKTTTKRDRDRKTLPAGEREKKVPHDLMCMQNPFDLRCIVGVRQVEDVDGPDGRLKRLLDGPSASPLKGPASISTTPLPVVGVGRTPEDNNDDRWYNENTSGNSNANRPGDILTISDGHSNVLTRLSQRSKLEVFGFTILFCVFSAWYLWKRVANGEGQERRRATVGEVVEADEHEHRLQNPVVEGDHSMINNTSIAQIALLDNGTIHPTPVIMNGHADPINDIMNVPIPILPTPSTPNLKPRSSIPLPTNSNLNPPPLPISQIPVPVLSQISLSSAGPADDNEDSDVEAEVENGAGAATISGKRKARRGKRGKKKKPGVSGGEEGGNEVNGSGEKDQADKERAVDKDLEEEKPSSLILTTSSLKPATPTPSLTVSDTILGTRFTCLPAYDLKVTIKYPGYGSHGTVVYQGSFQGRAVAVKRLLQDFVTLATREVSILQQSDDHPNVIRYYYQESHLNFFYIALELCPASLADIIESPHANGGLSGSRREEELKEILRGFDAKRAMRQVASGLRHLHGLGLIHRDIKPQNILISSSSSGGHGATGHRMLISDFGLCKKLDVDQTSFLPTLNGATGTVGWRAPEILRGDVKLDEFSTDDSTSSRGSVATIHSSGTTTASTKTRLTKSVDIFALGCLFYYTLTAGGHPYGDRFEREVNIIKDNKQLSLLSDFCSTESTEAQDLISGMLHPQPSQRPDTKTCLLHPFFWDPAKRLGFLQDASDRFEIMCREPKDAVLIKLEKDAGNVVGNDWRQRLDRIFIENLGKYRKYDGKSVQDLMRALRNKVGSLCFYNSLFFTFSFCSKKHHYQDLPDNVKRHLGPMPEGFLGYFTRRYPRLFMHVHAVVKDTGLHGESMFGTYFKLPEP